MYAIAPIIALVEKSEKERSIQDWGGRVIEMQLKDELGPRANKKQA